MPAAAQDTQATPSSTIQTQDIVARPIPSRTAGLEPGKVVRWTLKDAVLAALEKNVDIELERENTRMMQYDLIAFQGVYDPRATSTILYNKSISPTSFRAAGVGEGENAITRDTFSYDFGVTKNLERWGSALEANFTNSRVISNTNTLTTQYSPSMELRFTQPMFKNFGIDQSRRNIKIARRRLDLTDAQFRQRVILIISQVEQAYWNLSLEIQNEEVQRQSVKLAETFLDNTKRQVEVGTLAQISVVEAAASLEQRRQAVFQAMNQVGIAENTLKNLTAGGQNDELWSSVIEPVEPFDIKDKVSIPVADAVKLAHENRPEIRQQSLSKEINNIDIDFLRNQVKPQIDLIAGYRSDGIGGTPFVPGNVVGNCDSPVTNASGKPVCLSVTPVAQGGGVFVPGVVERDFVQSPAVSPDFAGGYGTALGNMFKNSFRTWSVGVSVTLPLRNRTAKANLGKALENERQIDLQTRQLMQLIEVEVRNAVQAVETAKMRIDAAESATTYARLQLEGEEKKFAAGLQSTYFVLQRQNELAVARVSELQAKADYNKAKSNLHRVMSSTLLNNSIELKQAAPVTIK